MEFLWPILAKIELICQQTQVSGVNPSSGVPERMTGGWWGGLAMWSLFIKKITVAYQVKEQNYSLNDFPSVKYNPWVSCWGWPLSSVCTNVNGCVCDLNFANVSENDSVPNTFALHCWLPEIPISIGQVITGGSPRVVPSYFGQRIAVD